jgi:HEAT repeat protein
LSTSVDSTRTSIPYTDPENLAQEFASRGIVALAPETLGIPLEVHARAYAKEKQAYLAGERVTPAAIPEILDLLRAPGLVAACNLLAGENWAVVPFMHNASFASGARDQHWHKDDNAPYNARKQRHHQPVQIELLYYPQAVTAEMGPTATIPYSHYWTFNHEENQDNFAGADHLDFDYQLSRMEAEPVSGPDSQYEVADIVAARTAHDVRMRRAVTDTGWPLVRQLEAAPLRAGSVLIYSHNTFHRGNHRRDDWRTWRDNPRFMWRFWLYRTTDPPRPLASRGGAAAAGGTAAAASWSGVDPMTGCDLAAASDDLTVIWRHHYHWLRTGEAPPPRAGIAAAAPAERALEAARLVDQLHARYDAAEPARIGAAYRLASIGDDALAARLLGAALYTERESVRRAATYGLIALGAAATDTFLRAARSPVKWVRKAGVHGLGDAGPLTGAVLDLVTARLLEDPSVYVRSVAAGSLGCLARRAAATGTGVELIPAGVDALVRSLGREQNRLAMDRAQRRSIKYVRPTDDSDLCEGGGVDFGCARFEPVRSAVRENALWALVIICSHGAAVVGTALQPALAALEEVIRTDRNVLSVGFAMDAVSRLVNLSGGAPVAPEAVAQSAVQDARAALPALLRASPIQPWEALAPGGMSAAALAAL